jgi:hypothetical protein
MVLIEAVIVGLAGLDRAKAISSLELLSKFRGKIDRTWHHRRVKT